MNELSNMPMVDSHLHFWQLNRGDYDWLTPDLGILYQDYLPSDWLAETKLLNMAGAVLVQATTTDAETDFLLSLAEKLDGLVGVVGWVDLEGQSQQVCSRLTQLSQSAHFKGIRPMLQDMPDRQWILNSAFIPIFEHLTHLGLSFDALIRADQIDVILQLAKRHPELRIVIDHCAKPNIANDEFALWAEKLTQFADVQNVTIKVSGLTLEASAEQQTPDDYRRYFELATKVFGPQRMMWGSDWPVVNINSDLNLWFKITQDLVKSWPVAEQQCFWSQTATTFYQLGKE